MNFDVKITPKFNVNTYIRKTIGKDWLRFQNVALEMGQELHHYIQSYINSNRKREGGTGNLANAIDFTVIATAPARVEWGIGNLTLLQTKAPYWYVVNYGKKVTGESFVPGGGKPVPGYFGGGNPPIGEMKGRGTESFTYANNSYLMFPGIIRPMNYIQATMAKLDSRFKRIIQAIRRSK